MGRAFILLITKVIDKKAIIRKDKKTIPKDFIFDFKYLKMGILYGFIVLFYKGSRII